MNLTLDESEITAEGKRLIRICCDHISGDVYQALADISRIGSDVAERVATACDQAAREILTEHFTK